MNHDPKERWVVLDHGINNDDEPVVRVPKFSALVAMGGPILEEYKQYKQEMALETWNNYQESEAALITAAIPKSTHMTTPACNERLRMDRADTETCYKWISGKPLMDKKSTFQAHLCRVSTERDVYAALDQLIAGSSKLQRASHNMLAWRISEAQADGTTVLKHDNSDDGEAQSGSKLAYLLGKTRSMFARIFDALDKKISFLLPLFK